MAQAGGIAGDHLRSFIERIERLEEEKKALADDIRDVLGEAKASGFDTKIMRKVIALRKMEVSDRQEQDAILAVYLHALGMEDAPSSADQPQEMEISPAAMTEGHA